jgi:hypothetical protein
MLDCLFCDRSFADFGPLAAHVTRAHEIHREQTFPSGRPFTKARGTRMSNIPTPSHDDGSGGRDLPDFLKASHIGKVGATVKATLIGDEARVIDGNFGRQLIVNLKIGKTVFGWSVKLDTPNHRLLYDRFGANPKRWKGKTLTLTVNPPIQKGYRPYVAIVRER